MNDPRAAAESRPTRADIDHGAMAQLVAHLLCKQGVRGSSPLGSTIFPCQRHLCRLKKPHRAHSSKVQQRWRRLVMLGGLPAAH